MREFQQVPGRWRYPAGFLIAMCGVAFLPNAMQLAPPRHDMMSWWPAALILIGVVQLSGIPGGSARLQGLLWSGLGSLLLLTRLLYPAFPVFRLLWAVFLLGAGIVMLIRRFSRFQPYKGAL